LAFNSGGRALYLEGHAMQNLSNGGLVKAMLYVDGNGAIVRCYNCSLPDGGTSLPPVSGTGCGFSVSKVATGSYEVNFPYQVDNRFISVSLVKSNGSQPSGVNANAAIYSGFPNRVNIFTAQLLNADPVDERFMLFIY
jgi:hypothetical protein